MKMAITATCEECDESVEIQINSSELDNGYFNYHCDNCDFDGSVERDETSAIEFEEHDDHSDTRICQGIGCVYGEAYQ